VAVLVRRTPGAPRPRPVCYLGAIPEGREADAGAAGRFWAEVEPRLDRFDLPDETRAIVLAGLQEVVPRRSEDPMAQMVERPWNVIQTARGGMP
jgi:hypothetical protein